MYLTIRDVLHLFQEKSVTLAAGAGGLDNMVSNVNIMDAPDIWNWVRPGDLILTTGFAIKDDPALQERLIKELAASGSAGLGIKTKRFLDCIPQGIKDAANQYNFPVMELPLAMSLAEIMNPIISSIAARQSYVLHRSNEIHKLLTREAVQGGGLSSIIACLGKLTQCPVGCYDTNGNRISHWIPANVPGTDGATLKQLEQIIHDKETSPKSLQRFLKKSNSPSTSTLALNNHDFIVSSLAIMSSNEFFGHIAIVQPPGSFNEINDLALEHACTVAALDFLKQKAVNESHRLNAKNLLEHVLFGDIDNPLSADLITASKLANSRFFQCVVIDLDKNDSVNLPVVMTMLYKRTQQLTATKCPLSLLAERTGQLILLISSANPLDTEADIRQLYAAFHESSHGASISIGVGSVVAGLGAARQSYKEALTCLDLGRAIKGSDQITFLPEVASYYILATSNASDVLDNICGPALAKLAAFDREHRSDLIKTMECYLECDKNLSETAKELYIHRNTLTNRLEKILDITGLSLDDHKTAFNFRLALQRKKLLGGVR